MALSNLNPTDVALFISDKAEKNPLLQGVRFDPEQIDRASVMVVDRFNLTPPMLRPYSVANFPYISLLLTGVCGWLLKGEAVNQASNQLSYQLDGVVVDDYNKAQVFAELGDAFWKEFLTTAQDIKITKNLSAAFGITNSDYNYLPNV